MGRFEGRVHRSVCGSVGQLWVGWSVDGSIGRYVVRFGRSVGWSVGLNEFDIVHFQWIFSFDLSVIEFLKYNKKLVKCNLCVLCGNVTCITSTQFQYRYGPIIVRLRYLLLCTVDFLSE